MKVRSNYQKMIIGWIECSNNVKKNDDVQVSCGGKMGVAVAFNAFIALITY
jgi:hypothetical protein